MKLPALLLVGLAMAAAAQAADRPNIVFIMADDHAAHAISAYGSRVNRTPNIDRLAQQGLLMRSVFVTNSICTPSRAAILTGQYSHINGVPMFNRFDSSRQTIARLLQAGGYHTGMIGKWHLGSDPAGFDRWEILPGQGAYVDPVLYTATGEKTYTGRYVTDVITDLAIAFIQSRPTDRPFFLMVHHKAPHRPWVPDEAHRRMFEGRWLPEPPTLWDSYATRTDALRENLQRVFADLTRRDLKLPPPHDPGDHNTRAHYGVRTRTHKLIYFWKKDQWELFDLVADPFELHNLYGQPGPELITVALKAELHRLKQALGDTDQFATEQLPNGVDGPVARLRGK